MIKLVIALFIVISFLSNERTSNAQIKTSISSIKPVSISDLPPQLLRNPNRVIDDSGHQILDYGPYFFVDGTFFNESNHEIILEAISKERHGNDKIVNVKVSYIYQGKKYDAKLPIWNIYYGVEVCDANNQYLTILGPNQSCTFSLVLEDLFVNSGFLREDLKKMSLRKKKRVGRYIEKALESIIPTMQIDYLE